MARLHLFAGLCLAVIVACTSAERVFPSEFLPAEPAPENHSTILGVYQYDEVDILTLLPGTGLDEEDMSNLAPADKCGKTSDPTQMCRVRPSFGSGIWLDRNSDKVWVISDRGPNGDCRDAANADSSMFSVPDFPPSLYSFEFPADASEKIVIDTAAPLYGLGVFSKHFVTGRSNTDTQCGNYLWVEGNATYPACPDMPKLDYDPAGVDPEDVARLPSGLFVSVEEYAPSVLFFDSRGKIQLRLIPNTPKLKETINLFSTGHRVDAILPACLALRRTNKGFENVAVSRQGRTLWVSLQSPMLKGPATIVRTIRLTIRSVLPLIVTYDGMYLHRVDKKNIKISSSFFLAGKKFLNLERDDGWVKIYQLDFASATNIKGMTINGVSVDGYNTLLEELDQNGTLPSSIQVATKTKVWDSRDMPKADIKKWAVSMKLEAVAPISRNSILLAEDNDFGLANGPACHIYVAHITSTLPDYTPAKLSDWKNVLKQLAEDDDFSKEIVANRRRVHTESGAGEVDVYVQQLQSGVSYDAESSSSESSSINAVGLTVGLCAVAAIAAAALVAYKAFKRGQAAKQAVAVPLVELTTA